MARRCERCNRRFERTADGGQCTTTANGTDPCFRTGIRWLDSTSGGGDGE